MGKSLIGLTPREIADYDLDDLVQVQLYRGKKNPQIEVISDQLTKKIGVPPRGKYAPFEVMTRATAPASGTNLIGGPIAPELLVTPLGDEGVADIAGAKTVGPYVGSPSIPVLKTALVPEFVADGVAPTLGAPVFDQVSTHLWTVATYVDISPTARLQSTPFIGDILVANFQRAYRLAVDAAMLHGAGSGSFQPTGIAGTAGIGSFSAADMDWPAALEPEQDLADAKANLAKASFITTPAIRGALKSRLIVAGAGMICTPDNTVNGYPCRVSSQVQAGYLFFGDFSQIYVVRFGAVDVLVDPYTGSTSGTVRVNMFFSFDIVVAHPLSFSVASDFS